MRALSTWRGLRSVCGIALLSQRFDFGLRPALRFCCSVFFSAYARLCVSGAASCLRSRLLFAAWRQTGRLAVSCVSIPPGRDRHSCVLAALARLSALEGSLRACTFLCGDLDGVRGTELRGARGTGLAARLCASLRNHIGLATLSAGRTLGLRAPDCAKESSTLWTLFTLRRGCVGADSPRSHPGTRKDPPGSNLWPGGSCDRTIAPTRTNIQTRAAPKRRGVGLKRAERSGSRHCGRPKPAPKSRMWKRHCRLSGLSSRCGGAVLVQIRRAVTRVQTETRPALIYGRAGRVTARSPQHAPTSRLEAPSSAEESG